MIDIRYRRFGVLPAKTVFFPDILPETKNCHFVQIVSYHQLPYHQVPFYNQSNYWHSRTSRIDLTLGEDKIFSNIHKKRRYIIRRGQAMDYRIYSQRPTLPLLKSFRSIYNQTIAKKTGGQFLICLDFYKAAVDNMTAFIGEYKGHLLEIMLVIHDNDKAWCYQIARPETQLGPEITYYIGSTLQWDVILYFKKKGYRFFDFGGVVLDASHEFYDFSRYKISFGGELSDLYWYYGGGSLIGNIVEAFRNKTQQLIHGKSGH